MKYCTDCGSKSKKGERFCTSCGANLKEKSKPKKPTKKDRKPSINWDLIALVAILIIAILVVAGSHIIKSITPNPAPNYENERCGGGIICYDNTHTQIVESDCSRTPPKECEAGLLCQNGLGCVSERREHCSDVFVCQDKYTRMHINSDCSMSDFTRCPDNGVCVGGECYDAES